MEPSLDPRIAANGRSASANFSDWFAGSAVVDEQGAPKVVFHSTFGDFDAFTKTNDLGFHFGSLAVAHDRVKESVKGRVKGKDRHEGLSIIAAHLRIENPLHLPEDPIAWEPEYLLKLVGERLSASARLQLKWLNEACTTEARGAAQRLREADGPGLVRKRQPWPGGKVMVELQTSTWRALLRTHRLELFNQFRKEIQTAGFDGLTYMNKVEGTGRGRKGRAANPENLTWVAFEASQVKSSIGNSGLYIQGNPSMTDWQADRELRLAAAARRSIRPSAPKQLEISP